MPKRAVTPAITPIILPNKLFIKLPPCTLMKTMLFKISISKQFLFLFLSNGNQVNSVRLKQTVRQTRLLSYIDVIAGEYRDFDAIRRL
jgi:hypothetical protein